MSPAQQADEYYRRERERAIKRLKEIPCSECKYFVDGEAYGKPVGFCLLDYDFMEESEYEQSQWERQCGLCDGLL